jgi:hypothetical protein
MKRINRRIPPGTWAIAAALILSAAPAFVVAGALVVERLSRRIALVAPYATRISWADAHPDAGAQRDIAGQIVGGVEWD